MPDPTGRVSHLPDFHRGVAWKEPCRVATTANITIATALNAGDTIDGVTLAAGDRVLVKDQSTGSQNGIYVAGTSPARAYDMDQDATTTVPASEVMGAIVYVIAGTANGGKSYKNTNTSVPILGTTALTFTEFGGGAPTGAAGGDLSGTYPNPSVVDDSHSHTASTAPGGGIGEILISDTPSTPLVFADLIQNEAQDDLVYADP